MLECSDRMFRGSRELSEENADAFHFDLSSVDYVLLTWPKTRILVAHQQRLRP
jgi:hypothetical protein